MITTDNTNKPDEKIDLIAIDLIQDIRYYFLKDKDAYNKLKLLFQKNSIEFKKYGITVRRYMDFVREAFERVKNSSKRLPLDPMSNKDYEYIEKCVVDLVVNLPKKVQLRDKK